MAFTENKANILGDLFDVYIDTVKAPYHATVSFETARDLKPVVTARAGTTPIAHIQSGVQVSVNITWQQMTTAELEALLDTGSSAPREIPVTSDAPTAKEIKLRPAGGADDANAITIYECILVSMRYENDGEGERQLVTTWTAQLNSSGKIMRIDTLV